MRGMGAVLGLLLLCQGCTLEVKKLFGLDGGHELGVMDRGPTETSTRDTAPPTDSAGDDSVAVDGAPDLGLDTTRDAVVPPDKSCPPEVCNGLDDDCDGVADDGACEPGCAGKAHGGSAFAFCTTSVTWSAAQASCAKMSMELASILDGGENTWVLNTAKTLAFPGQAWLGGSDAASEGTWVWPDGTTFWTGPDAGAGYAAWGQGEPNNSGGAEECLELILSPFNALVAGDWNDESCASTNGYICRD